MFWLLSSKTTTNTDHKSATSTTGSGWSRLITAHPFRSFSFTCPSLSSLFFLCVCIFFTSPFVCVCFLHLVTPFLVFLLFVLILFILKCIFSGCWMCVVHSHSGENIISKQINFFYYLTSNHWFRITQNSSYFYSKSNINVFFVFSTLRFHCSKQIKAPQSHQTRSEPAQDYTTHLVSKMIIKVSVKPLFSASIHCVQMRVSQFKNM